MIEQLQQQQLALLARKALLKDELDAIDQRLGQIGAILAHEQQKAAAEAQPSE
jgi:hypothetical protein